MSTPWAKMTPTQKEHVLKRNREWRAANVDRKRAADKRRRDANPEKTREYGRRWRAANPDRAKENGRRHRAANKDRYTEKERIRKGLPIPTRPCPNVCECCGRLPGKVALALDHCHNTQQFRGWLCRPCNLAIGILGDSIAGVQLATAYLQRAGR